MRKVPDGRLLLIPASAETTGHGLTGVVAFWREALADSLPGVG